jgi:hypothetical protein
MKKITISLLFLLAVSAANIAFAQAPNQFKYQAVLRDASGNIIPNTAETVVIDILQGGASGTMVYEETQSVTTTTQGIINLNIGAGPANSGIFANINWGSGTYWVKVTIGGTVISNGQLLSVPYALNAGSATSSQWANGSGGAIYYSGGNVGIGTTSSTNLLHLKGTTYRLGMTIESNSAGFGPEMRLTSTATGGHEWRIVSGASASNSYGAGSFELWDQTASASRFGILPNGNITLPAFTTAGIVHNDASGVLSSSLIVNADIDATAGITDTKLATISTVGKVSNSATTATPSNTISTIVLRDGTGNFSAGTITANFTGNLTGNATNVSGTVAIANGGTGATTAPDAINALLPAQTGNNGKFLTTNGSAASWAPGSIHAIGEAYGGGIVFYVYAGGQHGLIAATADQGTFMNWYNGSNTTTNAVRDQVNAGLFNTERIIINQGAGSYAAQICANYVGGGYGDWYLPSKFELNLLYLHQGVVGGFAPQTYWSSSEYNANEAWIQNLNSGNQIHINKDDYDYVRAIRAF